MSTRKLFLPIGSFFWQGFAGTDYPQTDWNANFSAGLVSPPIEAGINNPVSYIGQSVMSGNGMYIVVTPPGSRTAIGASAVVLKRSGNSFSIQNVTISSPYTFFAPPGVAPLTVSNSGILAGTIQNATLSIGAVWLSGPASAPTTHSDLYSIYKISDDGLSLFALRTDGNVVERAAGGDLVITAAAGTPNIINVAATNASKTVCVVFSLATASPVYSVYKKISGAWVNTATLSFPAGYSMFNYIGITGCSSDGTLAVGYAFTGVSPNSVAMIWDLTGSGTIVGTALTDPAGGVGQTFVGTIASNGQIMVGWSTFFSSPAITTKPIFWKKSESFSTFHDLAAFINSQGTSPIGTMGNYEFTMPYALSSDAKEILMYTQSSTGLPNMNSLGYVQIPSAP